MVLSKISIMLTVLLILVPIAIADEDETLEQVKEYAEKIKSLIDKYKEAEVDFVKQEIVTIKDQQGNPQNCDVAIYYNNGNQARFTVNGQYTGNFNHGKKPLTKAFSMRLANCACVPIETKHKQTWLEINEVIEKIKEVIQSETEDLATDKAKELAEKGVKTVFDKLGYGAAASGFLSGFGYGAAAGAPIGEYITENINKILDVATQQNLQVTEMTGDLSPMRPNVGWVTPRGKWGNFWGENPQLKNEWDITVRCTTRTITPDTATWVPIKQLIKKPAVTTTTATQTTTQPQGESAEQRRQREQQEKEEQQRAEKEQREREAREQQQREEARKRYEEEQRQLRLKAQEIAKICPICDPIRQQIEQVNEQIKNKEQEIPSLEKSLRDAQTELEQANRALNNARQRLNEFRNPRSWAESDGRRVTSTDLEVQRQLSMDNWQRYQNGEQTAQQTMDGWRNQNDPNTHAEAKKKAEARLEQEVANAEQAVQQAKQKVDNAQQTLSKATQELANLKKELDRLKKQLEECLKLCKEKAMQIAQGQIRDYAQLFEQSQAQTAQTPCEKYEYSIKTFTNGKLTTTDYESLSPEMKQRFVSPGQMKAIEEAKERCGATQKTTVAITPETKTAVTTPTTTQTQPQSCQDVCNTRGMTTKQQNWDSHILNILNSQGVCKKTASINFGQIVKTGECTCYPTSAPTITIGTEQLICKGTACGDIACGTSAECSCGPNCQATVQCNWGGWKNIGNNQYQPTTQVNS